MIPDAVQSCLTTDRVAFEKVNPNEYIKYLSPEYPDDLICLYQLLSQDRTTDMFITTDLVTHTLHLFFDHMLENIEITSLLPNLFNLVNNFLDQLQAMQKQAGSASPVYTKAIQTLTKYFQVAQGLLNEAAIMSHYETDESSYDEKPIKIPEIDYKSLYKDYPQDVQQELALINAAALDAVDSPVLGYKEDYTQFKPRGHYTKNERLKSYFRAMMWLREAPVLP